VDSIDLDILAALQESAVTSKAEIARRVGLTPTAVFERVRKLEERGTIRGYALSLDAEAFGLGVTAFVRVREDETRAARDTGERLAAIRGVQEVHRVAGGDGYLVKVRAADTAALGALLDREFRSLDSVRTLSTSIVLETVAEGLPIPLDGPPDPARGAGSRRAPPTLPTLLSKVQEKGLRREPHRASPRGTHPERRPR